MANYEAWYMEIGLIDGVGRHSSMTFRVPKATAQSYFAATDKTARDATAIGGLFTACLTVTEMKETYRKVWVQDVNSPVGAVDDDILRGNKIVIGYESGSKNLTFTVPGRDATSYTQQADKISIDIEAAGDFKTWYELVESVCLGADGVALSVTKAYLND